MFRQGLVINMFPKKIEWSSWSAIEKVTYIAQVLAPFSLLITVIFSYLSWQTQLTIFKAQSSPHLTIGEPSIEKSTLVFPITNTGGSEATGVCVDLHEVPLIERLDKKCLGSVQPGSTKEYELEVNEKFKKIIDYTPNSIGFVRSDNKPSCKYGSWNVIAFDISYVGAFGVSGFESKSIYTCGERK